MGIKTTKTNKISYPKRKQKACLNPNSNYETRKTRTKIQREKQESNKILLQRINRTNYDKKTYPRLVLNKPKVMKIFAFIYTYWVLSSRNFQSTCGPCSPTCTHMHPCVNYE